ncbi:major facilitator transporter [Streptomyces hygroscopicus]|uniref:MFS transporter n=1 Tax=Streptomyces hygroscopicus TaxID=1912 RepID=UPI00223EB575|nr:MFS transporter [Streptomyces hygroscopicus]MCW7945730.1 major facilitator transporter [Streptomyces hygroscopicus]
MLETSADTPRRSARERITRRQWTTLAGTTLGWGLEGFDASLFTLVVVPATKDILGPQANAASVAFHVGLAVTLFLGGWAVGGLLFGMLSDYFGRVRILMAGVLVYAVFTAASALAHEFWQLAALRFVAGLGSGVEGPVGAALIAETWNNRYRARAAGVMASGYAAGFFLASLVYGLIGAHGWRVTLLVAVVPAVVALFIRRYVREPEAAIAVRRRRAQRRAASAPRTAEDRFVLRQVFTPPLLRHTVGCLLISTGALFAFWSITTWTPQIITTLAAARGIPPVAAVATATALLNLGGVIGYASWGFIADAIGRRAAFMISFAASAAGVCALFPFHHSYQTYLWLLPLVGFGIFGTLGGNLVCFPELFPTGVRASAVALANSTGRLLTAAGPLVAGTVATRYFAGDLGLAVTLVSAVLLIGVVGVAVLPETKGITLDA